MRANTDYSICSSDIQTAESLTMLLSQAYAWQKAMGSPKLGLLNKIHRTVNRDGTANILMFLENREITLAQNNLLDAHPLFRDTIPDVRAKSDCEFGQTLGQRLQCYSQIGSAGPHVVMQGVPDNISQYAFSFHFTDITNFIRKYFQLVPN